MKKKGFQLLVLVLLILALPISIFLIGEKTTFFNKAYLEISGKDANLEISLTGTKPFEPNWQFFSQGGESSSGMLTPAIPSMKKLTPKYIRIDHIYDFYEPVGRNSEGTMFYYDWEKLDIEIKAITQMGAKPFISLSYMPPAISGGSEVDLPLSWARWTGVVNKTIEHISGRDGLAISDVYYEVWNEPDLFGSFKLKGPKNYLELYKWASLGAQSAKNTLPFKFGGPATTALYKSWVYDLLAYVKNNNLRMDFYSWHKYTPYMADYQTDLNNLETWKKEIPELAAKELVITESGHTPEVDSGYDTKFSAIHTLSVLTTNFPLIDKVFTFEVIDGEGVQKNWGRWGLLTNEKWGIPQEKDRFKALSFLNQMNVPGLALEIKGQGDFVKSMGVISGQSIKLLIVNYDPNGKHFERVPITITGLSTGEYNYKYSEFLGDSYQFPILISDNTWSTHVLFKSNTAAIIEISR
ncbi:MAG: hypothetical protein US62_C0023G0001 [Candidatus Woesebacteria bacterium GW2011_GWA1_37_8]|uniref:Glycosyl hydrolases family 39 N-terminal catalytic domain-containing protein n=1 Tax=Candidatus Woesebacteria bacterium GW2011_GWA1_37_8 TaxID=1618546 RepID=A0A0G0I146_9BACT|nr:MAG: hypothetical protein US39_C0003G0023 [Microgenomates group bacterium GW2011_GWC1_37_12b]KKQ44615.1 MAG: hypothetical protein US62_C0023G0001 [Candidatus Woesebacteria bacterium GW2011_GWA1_37_8]